MTQDHCAEEFNLRSAIVSYASTHHGPAGAPSARHKDQLAAKDVKWSHGEHDRIIATAAANGRIVIYDLHRPGLELARFYEHSRQVHRLAFNPHRSAWLLSGSQDATIRMWDLRMVSGDRGVVTCGSKNRFNGHSEAVRDIRWSPADGVVFAVATDSGAIQRWDIRKANAPMMKINAHEKACFSLDWHPDGKHLVSGGTDKQVKVWDFSSSGDRRQKPSFQLRTPQPVSNVRWRPPSWSAGPSGPGDWQSTQVVTSYEHDDPRIHLWDLRRPYIPFRELDRYHNPASDLLWHSNDLLWTVGSEGIFTQTDMKYVPQVVERRKTCSVAWNPNGDILAFTQKRPKKRRLGIDFASTEFLDNHGEKSASEEKPVASQSLTDESLDEGIISSSFRKRHGKASRMRPSKSLSNTPPTVEDTPSIVSLDKALAKGDSFEPCQVGIIGRVSGTTMDPALFRYFSDNYSPLMKDNLAQGAWKDTLKVLDEVFDRNAECAENASLSRLAQTWRLAKYSVAEELIMRVEEQRRLREQGKTNIKKKTSKDGNILEKPQVVDDDQKPDKLKNRLFKGVIETEGHKGGVSDPESTSNMTTPLAKPLPDSPIGAPQSAGSHATELDSEFDDIQPLPPSVISSNYNTSLGSTRAAEPPDLEVNVFQNLRQTKSKTSDDSRLSPGSLASERLKELTLQEASYTSNGERSAPRAIAGKADWRLQAARRNNAIEEEEDFEQKPEEKVSAVGDFQAAPNRPIAIDAQIPEANKPQPPINSRHDSADSFLMFSASTDSSHRAKSMGVSFSPKTRPVENSQADSESWVTGSSTLEKASQLKEDPIQISPNKQANSQPLENLSFEESPPDISVFELERSSSPLPFLAETNALDAPPEMGMSRRSGSVRNGTTDSADNKLPHGDGPSTPISVDPSDNRAWGAQSILREAVRYYVSSSPVDIQSAAHMLHKIHVLFHACDEILPYEECELIFKTYNEHLLRQSMHVEAAELRLLCAPDYPAVYDYAQQNTFINVYCYKCKQPYENPKRDNRRCHRCDVPQPPCSICMCRDPPAEWILDPPLPSPSETQASNHPSPTEAPDDQNNQATTDTSTSSSTPTLSHPAGSTLWAWCQGCGHGGHTICMKIWLNDLSLSEGGCPTPGCTHDCGPGPRREQNRLLQIAAEEGRRRDGLSGRKASGSGFGFAKRDSWAAGESRAVERVRGMLGGGGFGSGNAANATTTSPPPGPAASGSGSMVPGKKVRLVTPSEQGQNQQQGRNPSQRLSQLGTIPSDDFEPESTS